MPTILTHAAVPLAIGLGLGSSAIPGRLLIAGVIASIVPDFDVVSFRVGIAYADTFGHRGFSHSILFALLLAVFAVRLSSWFGVSRKTSFGFLFVATMSHGVLDMFTNGGLGVALQASLSDQRFFMPWQVIQVSPLSLHRIMSGQGTGGDLVRVAMGLVAWCAAECHTALYGRRWWKPIRSIFA